MANILTLLRVVCGISLLFCRPFSAAFYVLYLFAGITDMFDGPVARKTNSVSEFGARFDTAADFVFVAACMIKLFPLLAVPRWLYVWIGVIALIKAINLVSGFIVQKKIVVMHTAMNKITGALLFALPFTLPFLDLKLSAAIVCAAASFAAVQEGHFIRTERQGSL